MARAALSMSSSGGSASSPISTRSSSPELTTPSTDIAAEGFNNDHPNPHDGAHAAPGHGLGASFQQPIAIVGMACRLPGNVSSPQEFWELCSRARSGFMAGVPKDRFNHDAFYHPNPGKGGTYHAAGGYFLDGDMAAFDAPFFGLTEKEAVAMDPQQRLLLECTFEALESAGVPKHTIVGKQVGVFVGGSLSEYEVHLSRDSDTIPIHQATGCAQAMQSNRLSHFFDLRGPSFTVDTACSSSLTSLHVACQSLRVGESKAAIVGGCHLNLLPELFISYSTSRLLSDSGRSIAFDERGTGFGRGEGCGILILKPLAQALQDQDPIRAVIHGTGINQDGKTPGITMPNGDAQETLIKEVYRNAGIDPLECGYVEAHGTGTKIGDPTEAGAIYRAIGQGRTSRDPLYIGSVKSNIGHLEAASGIVAVMKAALMLERGFLLPNHDFKKPNTKIPWKDWNLKVPNSVRPWPKGKKYVSVNNFGFGGTNAHVILGKAPYVPVPKANAEAGQSGSKRLFVLTANDKHSLEEVTKKMVIYLEQRPEIFQSDLLNNLAYTLGRRSLLKWRVAIPATTSFDVIESINSNKVISGRETGEEIRIGFVFTGQGAQWDGMGRELYGQYPAYTLALDRADRYLKSLGAQWSLVEILCGTSNDPNAPKLSEAHVCQPACTAVQLGLVDLLRTWGIRPVAVAGHSSGEIAAAYAAGIINFEAALAIAYHRGQVIPVLKKKFPELRGTMMAVGMTKEEVQPILEAMPAEQQPRIRVACYNSPSSLTMSGDADAIAGMESVIEANMPDSFHRRLQVDVAYHSHHMNLVAKDYKDALMGSALPQPEPRTGGVRFHSSLYGHQITGSECNADYWVDNLTCAVRFSEALTTMFVDPEQTRSEDEQVNMLIELGPHSALQGPIKQILQAVGIASKVPYGSALVRKQTAVESAVDLAGSLVTKGAAINMDAINFPTGLNKKTTMLTDLPRYPWNHEKRYWKESSRLAVMHRHRGAEGESSNTVRSDLIGLEAIYSNPLEPTWRNVVTVDDLPWLKHHQIQGLTIFPMSGFIAMALETAAQRRAQQQQPSKASAANQPQQFDRFELRDVEVLKPLVLPTGTEDDSVEMTISLRRHRGAKDAESWDEFRICSWTQSGGWTEHCVGLVATTHTHSAEANGNNSIEAIASLHQAEVISASIAAVQSPDTVEMSDMANMYESVAELGVSYGPSFQGIVDCKTTGRYAVGSIAATAIPQPDNMACQQSPHKGSILASIHPTFLESMIEMYWPLLSGKPSADGESENKNIYLPTSVKHMSIARDITAVNNVRAYCHADFDSTMPKATKVDIFATVTENGASSMAKPLIEIDELVVSPVLDGASSDLDTPDAPRNLCYKMEWEALELAHEAGNSSAVLPDFDIDLIHGEESSSSYMVASELAVALEAATSRLPSLVGFLDSHKHVSSSDENRGRVCVVLTELDQPLLANVSEAQFSAIQALTATYTQGILWVTRGAYEQSTSPESNMISGLSRTVRSETLLPFATLDIDGQGSNRGSIKTIVDVFRAAFGNGLENDAPASITDKEMEFMERRGQLFTPRVINDDKMNDYIHRQTTSNPRSRLEPQQFSQVDRSLRLAMSGESANAADEMNLLHFVDDDKLVGIELGDDEIEFEVKAVGVNMQDANAMLCARDMSHSSSPTTPTGIEAAGLITRVGRHVDASSFAPGTSIACLTTPTHGAYATFGRATSSTVLRMPETGASGIPLTFEKAAALPLAYSTAYYALVEQARLQTGQRVLITSAAGPVGQAAAYVALNAEAEVFLTVGTEEERKVLEGQFEGRIAKEHILHHNSNRTGLFSAAIQRITQSKGVDVLLDLAPESMSRAECWASLARFGSLVQVTQVQSNASAATRGADHNASSAIPRNASLMTVDMTSLVAERPEILRRVMSSITQLLEEGKIPILEPATVLPFSQAETAFKTMQQGTESVSGKIVLVPRADDLIMATPPTKIPSSQRLLRADASYVVVGGTGGLGRSMARWMVANGAGTIILLTRRTPEDSVSPNDAAGAKVLQLIEDARAVGATVLVKQCDVTDADSVVSLFASGLVGLSSVRGIIHSAMVLRDVLFDQMTWKDYTTVTESKVQGAWNLHRETLLDGSNRNRATVPDPLDFFVVISSVSGVVGNRGQAAYAAANTFLDALVQHRRANGMAAASLALTAVSDAGYLADDGNGAERAALVARNLGGAENTICEAEVLALLGAAIKASSAGSANESECHNNHVFMTGMGVSASKSTKGAERPFWAVDAKFKTLVAADRDAQEADTTGGAAKVVSLNPSLDQAEAEDLVCGGLVTKIAQVLMMEPEELDVTRTLAHYPLDSLVAIEIRNFIAREYEASLQVLELLSSGSIQTLSKVVCRKSKLCPTWE
ncbi:ketoacyl-synt-domain-containing protein [Thozetella sp. PMI_491]|nr:ketoacyl-synt-domain-containing protein [Thozetella sp. PMI_491]